MKHFKMLALAATTALACSGAAVAGPEWTFAELSLATGDGDQTDDTSLLGIAGSFAVADIWHVQAEWATGETESNGGNDVDVLELGVGLNHHINDNIDLVIDLYFGNIDEDDGAGGSTDSDYLGFRFGVRSMLTNQFEFNAAINYADTDCPAGCGGPTGSAVDVGGQIGGRYLFDEAISVGISLDWAGAQDDLLTLDVRWAFGDVF